MMSKRILSGLCPLFAVALMTLASTAQADNLVGLWEFEDSGDIGKATIGAPLDLLFDPGITWIAGSGGGDSGAADVAPSSYFRATHGISPGANTKVNQYTIAMDISYPQDSFGEWNSLLQTENSNTNDGDLFIKNTNTPGTVGLAGIGGYSSQATTWDTWYRIVLTVDNGVDRSDYIDGSLGLDGNAGALDDRMGLESFVDFLRDNGADVQQTRISNLAIWDSALDANQVAALGVAGTQISAIPEPSSFAILGGVFSLAGLRRRRAA